MNFDIVVAGLGGMGSAIVAHCARRGAAVAGFDRFAEGHTLGSSAGRSRLIRKAYFEEPAYVPLLQRAYELWRALERETGAGLLHQTGVLVAGAESSAIVQGVERSAREHELPVERLSHRALAARYPTLRLRDDEIGIFEPEGGVLLPERAMAAHLESAAQAGAQTRFDVSVEDWQAGRHGFEIRLSDQTRVQARVLVLAMGPWLRETLESLHVPTRIQRNVQAWFTPNTAAYGAPNFPGFLVDRPGLPAPLYGFPDFGDGVKAAFHGSGSLTTADDIDREIDLPRDIEPLAAALGEWMPGAAHRFREGKACLYTLTPDHHFVVDRHPVHHDLLVCGGFSGHGFKFAPVIGEIAADLALRGETRHNIGFLSLQRFAAA
ncbi:N-methyl-L-tryptophan oxidase [soil metagenome]|nr:N-methyl-L-tryptophan oxidase [Chthoniobacterales bacterium]